MNKTTGFLTTIVFLLLGTSAVSATTLFESNWSTATGTSDNAITDGGAWNFRMCGAFTTVANIINGPSVGWSATPNVMEVTRAGQDCTQVERQPIQNLAIGEDYYIRMYIRNDAWNIDGFAPSNHPIAINSLGSIQAVPWSHYTFAAGQYYPKLGSTPTTGSSSDQRWVASTPLQNNVWYRFEWYVDYINVYANGTAQVRIHPRIYDISGNLIRNTSTYSRAPGWGGNTSQTLQQWYDAGNMFVFTDTTLARNFGVGYEGPGGATNTGQHWYYAAVKITDAPLNASTWVGPAGTEAAPDTTPPIRSNGLPSGTQPAGTTNANISVTTNEPASCRFGTAANTAYATMPFNFTITGGLVHNLSTDPVLTSGVNYTVYVRCMDSSGNVNTDDYPITFSINVTQGLLFSDNFDNGQKNNANGFTWDGGTSVSNLQAYSGQYSMLFRYLGDGNNPTRWAEERFTIAPNAASAPREVWIEFMLRVPDDWVHPSWYTPWGNNKLFAIWGEEYNTPGETHIVLEYIPSGSNGNYGYSQSYTRIASALAENYEDDWPDQVQSWDAPVFGSAQAGEWVQIRMHYKAQPDASIIDVWSNGTKVASVPPDYSVTAPGWAVDYFRKGYVLGWANSGSYALNTEMVFYVDDFKVYNADPGWSDSTPPVRSNAVPSGQLPAGTTMVPVSITTDETAHCKVGFIANTAYASIQYNFTITGGTTHNLTAGPLPNGANITLYTRCMDSSGNVNTNDYPITISIANTTACTCANNACQAGNTGRVCNGCHYVKATSEFCADAVDNDCDGQTDEAVCSQGVYYYDNFESYNLNTEITGGGANGFTWLSPLRSAANEFVQASNDLANSGSKSLKFHFNGDPDVNVDASAEQRFSLGRNLTESWAEFYMYFPDGTEGVGPRYEQRAPNGFSENNKFFLLWGAQEADYNDGSKTTLQLWSADSGNGDSYLDVYVGGPLPGRPDSYPGDVGPAVIGNADRGRWVQFREYVKLADRNTPNGIVMVWKDGNLIFNVTDAGNFPNFANIPNVMTHGYILGWANSGFDEDTNIYVDDISFFDENPGWTGSSCTCANNACQAGNTGLVCNGCTYVAASTEVCSDSVDNDCDGNVDEACAAVIEPTVIEAADVNEDGSVSLHDISLVAGSFRDPSFSIHHDLNSDGTINLFDIVRVAKKFGTNVPPPPLPRPVIFVRQAANTVEVSAVCPPQSVQCQVRRVSLISNITINGNATNNAWYTDNAVSAGQSYTYNARYFVANGSVSLPAQYKFTVQ